MTLKVAQRKSTAVGLLKCVIKYKIDFYTRHFWDQLEST